MNALNESGAQWSEGTPRLLIVEDDAIVARDVEGALTEMGYEVADVIRRGEWALEAVREEEPDLVLMDIRLAGDVDGVEAGETIGEETGVPVVYLTAYADEETRTRVRHASPYGYVVKPFSERDLQTAIEVALLRHRMERRLRESERRFRQMAESIEEVFWLRDPANEEMHYVSPAFEKIWGRSLRQLYENPRIWMESVHPEDRERIVATVLEEQDPGFELEYRIVRPEGEVRWIHDRGFPVTDDEGRIHRVAGVARDITRRREARFESEARRRRLSRILETTADGLLLADEEGRFEYANPAAEEILGLEKEEIVGRSYGDSAWKIAGPDGGPMPVERLPVARVLAEEEPVRGVEHSLTRPDGSRIVLRVNANPLRNADGAMTGVVASIRDVTEQHRFEAELEQRALHDYLTGLPNRPLFRDRLEQALERARRSAGRLAVLFVDLKRFKVVNDSLGHDAGDRVLEEVARRLEGGIRGQDTVARIGGDEFTVLLEEVDGEAGVHRVAERLASVFQEPVQVGGHEIPMDASIGVALHHPADDEGDVEGTDLLRRADAAMYRAKEMPGTRYTVSDPTRDAPGTVRLERETRLRRALEEGRLRTVYQPIYSVDGGELRGVEALARWEDPELGEVSPAEFIPVAEETGLIVRLGEEQLERACRELQDEAGLVPGDDRGARLHVNLSARQLEDPDLVERVAAILRRTGFPTSRLCLEITESAALREAETVEALKEQGIRLAVDDFGTQYSTLAQLRELRADALKIDRTFVAGLPGDERDRAIVETVLTLGRSLGVEVIAEGIETAEQLSVVGDLGCPLVQGFHLGRPTALEELAAEGGDRGS